MARNRTLSRATALVAAAALLLLVAAAARADCSLPCSCSYGLEFGESLCNYANFTVDVKAFRVRGATAVNRIDRGRI